MDRITLFLTVSHELSTQIITTDLLKPFPMRNSTARIINSKYAYLTAIYKSPEICIISDGDDLGAEYFMAELKKEAVSQEKKYFVLKNGTHIDRRIYKSKLQYFKSMIFAKQILYKETQTFSTIAYRYVTANKINIITPNSTTWISFINLAANYDKIYNPVNKKFNKLSNIFNSDIFIDFNIRHVFYLREVIDDESINVDIIFTLAHLLKKLYYLITMKNYPIPLSEFIRVFELTVNKIDYRYFAPVLKNKSYSYNNSNNTFTINGDKIFTINEFIEFIKKLITKRYDKHYIGNHHVNNDSFVRDLYKRSKMPFDINSRQNFPEMYLILCKLSKYKIPRLVRYHILCCYVDIMLS